MTHKCLDCVRILGNDHTDLISICVRENVPIVFVKNESWRFEYNCETIIEIPSVLKKIQIQDRNVYVLIFFLLL